MSASRHAKLAARWRCNERTIHRWIADGAPITKPTAMLAWLATRKSLPPGTRELVTASRSKRLAEAREAIPAPEDIGAASALSRLERAEAAAYAELQAAVKEGNPVAIKFARDGWIKVSESLRRYDLAVESMRRSATEMIPRAAVERFAEAFINNLRMASIMWANEISPRLVGREAAEICDEIKRGFVSVMLSIFAANCRHKNANRLPPWMLKACLIPIERGYPDALSTLESAVESESATTENENANRSSNQPDQDRSAVA